MSSGLAVTIEPELLRPLVKEIARELLVELEEARAALSDKMAFGEEEASRLLSLNRHQLRDERRRGRISASIGPGGLILYKREDLANYLAGRRWQPKEEKK